MVKVALVGAGGMASIHARGYAALPNADLKGIMDIRPDVARNLANPLGAKGYSNFEEMLSEIEPDVVDVSVPTPFHIDYVLAALKSSAKAVIVEKPMARTVADCRRMIDAATDAGKPLFVAHVLRFFPEYAEARRQVLNGAVGNPATVRMRRGGQFPMGWENWYGKTEWSGGVPLDLIIHDFDWLRWTFGDVTRVFAKALSSKSTDEYVSRDYALVTLRFESGVVAHVEGTWADPGGFKVAFEIAGDDGLLEYNFNQPASPTLLAALVTDPDQRVGVPVPDSPVAVNPYQAELEHFLHCLETGEKPIVSPEDGLAAVAIAEAANESAKTGKPVQLSGGAR
ncbi:MAG: Gfo/Idh/MocA family oxidoreductase [Chthonomonadales bacterium]